ncbi:MAG: SDR family NAD(P)-dependent oxidoreductase, partial [Hyphomicrobiaceae bacterium]|nr:SDR family NAD(P)-dependent oxidoreductase [Hyphomicrobiaceae bacterium]
MQSSLLQAWRRRRWQTDPAALAAYQDLKPMVVVTGASEGIGYALARRFAAAGNDLIVVARRPQPLEQAAARIRAD